jgi:queuosine biosynthesis protein QueD
MNMEIQKQFKFEASHVLPKHKGKCSRLHGHSWVLYVAVQGDINPETGFVMDYAELKDAVQPIVDSMDHRHLGTWDKLKWELRNLEDKDDSRNWWVKNMPIDFYPSSENLLVWIAGQIGSKLDCRIMDDIVKNKSRFKYHWSRIELNETCTSKAILTREEYERLRTNRKG